MKKFIAALALVIATACGASTGPAQEWDRYSSVQWEYNYENYSQHYTEGLYSVSGVMRLSFGLEQAKTLIEIGSEEDIIASLWAVQDAAPSDTSRGQARVWTAGNVLRGVVAQTGDTLRIVNTNAPQNYMAPGYYLILDDGSIQYVLYEKDATHMFSLRITFRKD